jgi:hypothetical protein
MSTASWRTFPAHLRFLLMLASSFLPALGCAGDFEPYARLTRLRVLAIRAEPVNPAPGQTTTFEPLVYAPPADAAEPFTYAWSWCPLLGVADDGYKCPLGEDQLQQLRAALGSAEAPPLTLGTERTQSWRNPFPTAALAQLCRDGFSGIRPDCEDGFPVRIYFTVTHAGVEQKATTVLRLPIADGVPSNANPHFEATGAPLAIFKDGAEQPITSQSAPTLPRLKDTELRVHVADAEAESYMGTDNDNKPAVVRERLVLTWFVETGDVENEHTGYFPGETAIAQFLEDKWKPGKKADYQPDRAQLILVLRDSRGGVGWASGSVNLEPTP